jgi:hypothetical protein
MSLELAAKHLASRGRKGDTMLVHMAPEEVSGLQALARAGGGTLTINPDTGLPEANFLKRMLPTLIGAGLSFIPGVGPLMAAGLVGGFEGVRTGSLEKGLMAGLGAYGGAGLAGGLKAAAATGAAAPTALTAPAGGLSSIGGSSMNAAAANAMGGAGGVGSSLAGLQTGVGGATAATSGGLGLAPGATTGLSAGAQYGLSGAPLGGTLGQAAAMSPTALTPGASYALAPQALSPVTQAPGMFSTLGQGVNALGTEAGRTAFLGNAASKGVAATGVGGTSGLLKAGMAAAAPMMQPGETKPYVEGGPNYEYTYDSGAGQYTRVPVGTRDALTQLPRMFAEGGPIQNMSDQNRMETMMANGGQMFTAGGGVSHLGDYSDGGRLLKGPGDGVSDSIPATIADKRPARLADGEFVVPARIVSELGNGSTDAGARKLYAMMDRIQKARGKTTGKDRVAVNSRAEKLLPA